MVGHQQPVGRHERPRRPHRHRRLLHVLEPRRRGLEVILAQRLQRRRGDKPHALVCAEGTGANARPRPLTTTPQVTMKEKSTFRMFRIILLAESDSRVATAWPKGSTATSTAVSLDGAFNSIATVSRRQPRRQSGIETRMNTTIADRNPYQHGNPLKTPPECRSPPLKWPRLGVERAVGDDCINT